MTGLLQFATRSASIPVDGPRRAGLDREEAIVADDLHRQIVDEALTRGTEEIPVKLTLGELILYHTLLQDHGIDLVGADRFIPLMERSVSRIEQAPPLR